MNPPASRVILTCNGGYPRNGDSSEEQILRKTLEAFAHGERTIADLVDAENVVTRFLVSEQVRAGVELLTDACARWADPISHFAGKFEGVAFGEARPLPGTQITFKVPRIVAKPKRRPKRTLTEEYRFACNALGLVPTANDRAGRLSVKPVLTGPYTLARFSESGLPEYEAVEARAEAFAELLALEVAQLALAGATILQVNEPAILEHPEDWEILRRTFSRIAGARDGVAHGKHRLKLALHVHGDGQQVPLLEKMLRLPADILGLDFTTEPGLIDAVAANCSGRSICAGFVSSDPAKQEDETQVRGDLEKLLAKVQAPAYVGPTVGLETLSRDAAFAKLAMLSRVLKTLS